MAEAWLAIADALGHARRRRDDAQVLGARIGQDVAAAQMNLVAHQLAADVEIAAVDTAAVGDVELGEQARQHLLAGAGHRAEFAERFLVRAGINPPVGVVADAGDAYEEVDIAHDFEENKKNTKSVLERLRKPVLLKKQTPTQNIADAMANGMPEANRHGPPAPNN